MRSFYLAWSHGKILQTLSAKSSTLYRSMRYKDNLNLFQTLPTSSLTLVRLRATALREEPGRSHFL